MDNSGISSTNTNQTSPFAPIDIPDINNVAAPSAMPPMNAPIAQPQMAGNAMGVDVEAQGTSAQNNMVGQAQAGGADQGQMNTTASSAPNTVPVATQTMTVPKANTQATEPAKAAAAKSAAKNNPTETNIDENMVIPTPKMSAEHDEKTATKATPKTEATSKPVVKDVEIAASSLPKSSLNASVTIEPLLEECIRQGASDLHIQTGLPPILRVDGALRPMTNYSVLDDQTVKSLVFSTLDDDQQKILIKDKEFDYSFAFGEMGRFRVNAFQEKGNMAAAFRLIPNVIRTVQELGIPGVVEDFANRPNGLVLVTGPTGSGKSTTLAALVDKVNSERSAHIITIEDPIEFTHRSKRSVVAQREVHYDTYSFAAALRSILREDPDVVLIGEMRDLETIQAAITVAETGHLVFATLHTNSAAQSIDRMVDVFPAHQQPQVRTQLANILVGICSQRLIPAIDGGRIAVAEILVANSAVRAIIREGKTHQLDMAIQTGVDQGMQTMDRELAKYVKSGIIAYDTAREYAVDTAEFDRLARG